MTVYIGVGSNIGNREDNIAKAFLLLNKYFLSLETASLYESKALYYKDQPDFLNTVFKGIIKENRTPEQILSLLLKTENSLGRERCEALPKGPRNIDLDLLLFENHIINKENLIIPHPGITERLFVLLPLLEFDKNLKDPSTVEKYDKFLNSLEKEGIYFYKSNRYIEKYKNS
ncbi:MAG: 2-amino-4-hydroxy-6-hydroxymethyldihydropteridine diphosphokinase [Spirochaetaceae bacterium]|nr:2-amino-4-hydroxy-6-hydroxymethyldihydropteridine diphosphokinase [Spirochaetaceae bacterium]